MWLLLLISFNSSEVIRHLNPAPTFAKKIVKLADSSAEFVKLRKGFSLNPTSTSELTFL